MSGGEQTEYVPLPGARPLFGLRPAPVRSGLSRSASDSSSPAPGGTASRSSPAARSPSCPHRRVAHTPPRPALRPGHALRHRRRSSVFPPHSSTLVFALGLGVFLAGTRRHRSPSSSAARSPSSPPSRGPPRRASSSRDSPTQSSSGNNLHTPCLFLHYCSVNFFLLNY
jgi:hypothetical protein